MTGAGGPYARGSETSRAAAESIAPAMPELRHRVWLALELAGQNGLTDEEIGERTGLGGNTVRPRRGELERTGLVVDSGRTRPTKSGRRATVWVTRENAPKEHAAQPPAQRQTSEGRAPSPPASGTPPQAPAQPANGAPIQLGFEHLNLED